MEHLLTTLAKAAVTPDPLTGGVVPAIQLSTTFERDPDGSYPKGYYYSREGNPTRTLLERSLATLEGGHASLAFSSGMAASNAVLQALPHDAHLIMPDDVYHGLRRLVVDEFEPRGLKVSIVDMTNPRIIGEAIRPDTQLIWIETPSNPLLKITDIRKIASIAKQAGAMLLVDGTWTTPLLQQPFTMGADLVLHSLTKYIGGHSDTLGGAVITRTDTDFYARISSIQKMAGAVLDPFSSWLTLRGLRSLGVRLTHQCSSARQVASFLASHDRVKTVHYPGLKTHPGHAIAAAQMSDFGAMISFEVAGGESEAIAVAAAARVFTRATSLGGTESLLEHRASMEGPHSRTPRSLLRLSIGLEHPGDLIDDLSNALEQIVPT